MLLHSKNVIRLIITFFITTTIIMACVSFSYPAEPLKKETVINAVIEIPGAERHKEFPVRILLKDQGFEIQCKKRIFHLTNEFDKPFENRLFIPKECVAGIIFEKSRDNKTTWIEIIPEACILKKYRNVFTLVHEYIGYVLFPDDRYTWKLFLRSDAFTSSDIAYFKAIHHYSNVRKGWTD